MSDADERMTCPSGLSAIRTGEPIVGHDEDGGPVVQELTDVSPAQDTTTVSNVRIADLRDVVTTRLPDDYPSVWVVVHDGRLAVCDHKSSIPGAGAPALADLSRGIHREEVVAAPDDARKGHYERECLRAALNQFDADERITVYVEDDSAMVLVGRETAVGIAPLLKKGQGGPA